MKKALVVPRVEFEKIVNLTGDETTLVCMDKMDSLVKQHGFLADRYGENGCETNTDLLQIIPYITVEDNDAHILGYIRSAKAGEERLHGKHSVGFGGHIELTVDENNSFYDLLLEEAKRELIEEIPSIGYVRYRISATNCDREYIVIYNKDSSDVSSVHIGVIVEVSIIQTTEFPANVACIVNNISIEEDEQKRLLPADEIYELFDINLNTMSRLGGRLNSVLDKYEDWSKTIIKMRILLDTGESQSVRYNNHGHDK